MHPSLSAIPCTRWRTLFISSPPCLQVAQLTGFSDPIYAEAYVNVNQYDIVLDVLIVNQTADTLQNVTLELATLGKCSKSLIKSLFKEFN